MNRFILGLIFSTWIMGAGALAQSPLSWMSIEGREQNFPTSIYLSGFAYGDVRGNQDIGEISNTVRKQAQINLSQNIRVRIENTTQTQDRQSQYNQNIDFSSLYDSYSKMASNAEIIGVEIRDFYDKNKQILYAFAYVKRQQVILYHLNQIEFNLQKGNDVFDRMGEYLKMGDRIQAQKSSKELAPLLAQIDYSQDLLTALDPSITKEQLHLSKSAAIRMRLTQNVPQYRRIYVESKEDIFGKPSPVFCNKIKYYLMQKDCRIIDDIGQADYILSLEAVASKLGDASAVIKYAHLDVQIKLLDAVSKQLIFEDNLRQKGGENNHESAAREAILEASRLVIQKIEEFLK